MAVRDFIKQSTAEYQQNPSYTPAQPEPTPQPEKSWWEKGVDLASDLVGRVEAAMSGNSNYVGIGDMRQSDANPNYLAANLPGADPYFAHDQPNQPYQSPNIPDRSQESVNNIVGGVKSYANNIGQALDKMQRADENAPGQINVPGADPYFGHDQPSLPYMSPDVSTMEQYNARNEAARAIAEKPLGNLAITPGVPAPIRIAAGALYTPFFLQDVIHTYDQNAQAQNPDGSSVSPITAIGNTVADLAAPVIDPIKRAVTHPIDFAEGIVNDPNRLWSDVFLPATMVGHPIKAAAEKALELPMAQDLISRVEAKLNPRVREDIPAGQPYDPADNTSPYQREAYNDWAANTPISDVQGPAQGEAVSPLMSVLEQIKGQKFDNATSQAYMNWLQKQGEAETLRANDLQAQRNAVAGDALMSPADRMEVGADLPQKTPYSGPGVVFGEEPAAPRRLVLPDNYGRQAEPPTPKEQSFKLPTAEDLVNEGSKRLLDSDLRQAVNTRNYAAVNDIVAKMQKEGIETPLSRAVAGRNIEFSKAQKQPAPSRENMSTELLNRAHEAGDNGDFASAYRYAEQSGSPEWARTYKAMMETNGGTKQPAPNLTGKVKGAYNQPNITKRDFLNRVSELFLPVRTGRIGKAGVEGFANHNTGIIRTRNYGDLDVAAHEVGHVVDAALDLRGNAGAFDGEFARAVNSRFGKGAYSPEQVRGEGIAEFMRDYIMNPDQARRDFPKYHAAFEDAIRQNPDVAARVNEFKDMARVWREQSPEARARGGIVNAKDVEKGMMDKARDAYYNFKEKMIDDKAGLDKVVSDYEKITGEKLATEDNPYLMTRIAPNSAVTRAQMLVEGKSPELVKDALNKSYGGAVDHAVTMKSILDGLKDPSLKANTEYLKRGNFRDWTEALDTVLVARRQVELQDIYPNYKGPMSRADAEAVIRNAPAKLHELAEKCYQYNDNILRILTHEGMIKPEVYRELISKYKNYVSMSRDFTNEAALERGMGMGRGFANVRAALKSISEEGSNRQVVSPLESMMKNTYTALNLVERNRVGKTFANLSKGEKVGRLVEEVSGTSNIKDSTFSVWENGEKKTYQTDPAIYRAIMSMNQEASNMLWNILAKPAGWLRAGATITPDFALKNLTRDTLSAMIYSRYGFVPVVDHFRGLSHYVKQDALYHEYQSSGALMSTLVGLDRKYNYNSMQELIKGGGWKKHNPIELMRAFSEAIETSTRLGEYAKARDKGASMADSALSARDITLDFSKAGSAGRRLNQITAFFNAAVQEPVRMAQAFKENPIGTSAKIGTFIVAPSVALWSMNHDQDWYKELPQYQKDLFWVFKAGDTVYRIPKPFGVGVLFGSGAERMLDYFAGKDPQAMKRWAVNTYEALMPNFMPTIATPIMEWQSNYSLFMDRNIIPQREQNLPNYLQYGPDTSELAKAVGKYFDQSPRKIDSAIYSLGGGLARQTLNMADAAAGKRDYKNPYAVAFTVDPYKSPQSIQDFYDRLGDLEKQANGAKLQKTPLDAASQRNHAIMSKANDVMQKLNKQERETLQSNLPTEQKNAKVQAINKQQAQLAQAALKQLK